MMNAVRGLFCRRSASADELIVQNSNEITRLIKELSRQIVDQQVAIAEIRDRVTSLLDNDIRSRRPLYAEAAATMEESLSAMASLPEDGAVRVAFITDSGYALPTAVAISSMLRHRAPETKYTVTVVAQGLRPEDKALFAPFGQAVSLLETENEFADLFTGHKHVSAAALLKFNLPSLFPGADRILYLDGDILVFKDLAPLWNTPLGGSYAAAAKDFAACAHGRRHVAIGHANYFNTGVMLLNLALMRGDSIAERLIDAKRHEPAPHPFVDQTAFNIVFGDKVEYVSPMFNMMLANNRRWAPKPANVANFYGLTEREYDKVAASPAILHLTNAIKPWSSKNAPSYELWQDEFGVYGAFRGK